MKTWSRPTVPSVPGEGLVPVVLETASGERRALTPAAECATLYVCGITPYDATHLGHAATYLTFDTVQRAWLDAGYDVTYVQNVTDVDEPLLERAERDGVHWEDLAADQIALFHEDMEAMAVLPPQHYVGAVEGIPSDVAAVERMLASGHAYRVPAPDALAEGAQDVYLDLTTTPGFGHVSHLARETMLALFAERGGDPAREGKRDALDPLLWRAQRDGEPHWGGGSLGPGRPGWHIECTTIALDHLGGAFDLQGGGDDLVFPHHEMSAAQGEALGAHPFARAYVHQAMVGLDGEKMSKSKGNLVLVSVLRREGVDPRVIRLALLSQHRGQEWSWTDAHVPTATARLERWARAAEQGTDAQAAGAVRAVREAVADDLDTPRALAAVDAWAERVLAAGSAEAQPGAAEDTHVAVLAVVDALLGIRL